MSTSQTLTDAVRAQAALRPEQAAVLLDDDSLTFAELIEHADRVGNGLRELGVGAGDRVGILSRSHPVFFEVFYGTAGIGAVLVPVNWRLAPEEAGYVLADAGCRVVFVSSELASLVTDERLTVFVLDDDSSYVAWRDEQPATPPAPGLAPDDDAVLQIYTSGTTGRPKGAVLANHNFFAQLAIVDRHPEPLLDWNAGEVVIVTTPLFHVSGIGFAFWTQSRGGTVLLIADFDPATLLQLVEQHQAVCFSTVPSMLDVILDTWEASPTDLSSVRTVYYGAAPITPALAKRAGGIFECRFVQFYGLTEHALATVVAPSDHVADGGARMLSVGKPLDGVDMRIVDAEGNDVPVGVTGEIALRSPTLMLGYWNLPEETAAAMTADGFFRTGDAAAFDDEGYVHLKDRVKDMIISGGENIYPAEVERVIADHPAVKEVAVVGVPDDRWGETPKAFVVLNEGRSIELEELRDFASDGLARYKLPRQLAVIDVLPRNATGKVLRRELRDR